MATNPKKIFFELIITIIRLIIYYQYTFTAYTRINAPLFHVILTKIIKFDHGAKMIHNIIR